MKKDRKALIEHIRQLKRMTADNGCAPAEVAMAARKATQLMAEYDLDDDDVELGHAEYIRESHRVDDEVGRQLLRVVIAISELTDTKHWLDDDMRAAREFTFMGREVDVAVANFILSICDRSMRNGLAAFSNGTKLYRPEVARRRNQAYLAGMAEELAKSIREIDWVRRREDRETGKGIILKKGALLAAELKRIGMTFGTASGLGSFEMDRGHDQGVADGARVQFNAGVGAGGISGFLK